MRLFVAVDIEKEIAKRFDEVLRLLSSYKGIKPVESHNLHITLKFIGEVSETISERIIEKLNEISAEKFQIHLKGFGFFPNKRNPRVIWVGVEEGKEKMEELAKQVNSSLKRLGFKIDDFTPHLTIGRIKRASPNERRSVVEKLLSIEDEFGYMFVKEFKLKKSILTSKGPIYEDLAIYKLSDPINSTSF